MSIDNLQEIIMLTGKGVVYGAMFTSIIWCISWFVSFIISLFKKA